MFREYDLLIYDQLDSTHNEAKRLAQSGYIKNAAIIAYQQTAGRGKDGRAWISEKGNLYCTIMLSNITLPIQEQHFFCLISALAVYDTISSLKPTTNNYNIFLKWPNDIMLNDKKLCGILLESITISKIQYLFTGIGINIVSNPQNLDRPTTNLYEIGICSITPKKLLSKLLPKFEEYCNLFKIKGNEYIVGEYLKRAYKLNEKIIFKYDENNIIGIFRDINSNGDILIETSNKKILNFSLGEIFCFNQKI